MIRKLLLVCVAAMSVVACGPQMPALNFSPPNVGPTQVKLNAEVKSITVTLARPEEATGEVPYGAETITPIWKEAIQDAIVKMAIFRDDAPRKVSLSVKILKINPPSFGGDMTTVSAARYEIIERSTGAIIFTTDINSDATVPLNYAFVGAVRARESVNRSVQNNILQFLQQLETVNLDRPMLPVPAAPNPGAGKTGTGAPSS